MNTALEYSTRVGQEGGRRCKKSTLNDFVHLTPLRIPLMNPPIERDHKVQYRVAKIYPENFQSFIVVLKSGIFNNYFAETASYVCPSVNKLNQTNSGKDVSRGRYKNRE